MMKERYAIIAAVSVYALLSQAAFGQCTTGTGSPSHLIAGRVIAPIGTPIQAMTPSGACAGEVVYDGTTMVIPIWRADSLSAAVLGRTGGFQTGEEIAYVATETGATGDLTYRLYPYQIGYDNMSAGEFFTADALTEAAFLMPAVIDTATASWAEAVITPTDTTWTASLTLTADVPLGAVIVELRIVPDGGITPRVNIFTPAAQTYFSGDTLAAAFIGAGARTVTWQIGGTGSGSIEIRRIRATDRDTNLVSVAVTGPLSVQILPFVPEIAGDIDDDGAVGNADVGALFVALVTDSESSLERADVFPVGGDGTVDLLDLYYLARAVAQGVWWDGRAL